MLVMPLPRVIVRKLVQPLKACLSKFVTLFGIAIESNRVQPQNEDSPIVVRFSGNFRVDSEVHTKNAILPMFVMLFGNVFGLLDASFRTSKQFHMQSIAMKISMLIEIIFAN